ncbi:hypothetical protein, partial [Nocardia asiatica]|uniref:hypothetical protein n=1 Tax=Nocardia asiatica TaxID=209252 RepID=UPI002458025C
MTETTSPLPTAAREIHLAAGAGGGAGPPPRRPGGRAPPPPAPPPPPPTGRAAWWISRAAVGRGEVVSVMTGA